jgi:hypothetical protein
MQESDHEPANVRSKRYWVARTVHPCAHCGRPTSLAALAVPPAHETLFQGEEAVASPSIDRWESVSFSAFLFNVGSLSNEAALRIAAVSKGYRLALDLPDRSQCWANHCDRCGIPQDDHELFCEPEGAFFPIAVSHAAAIELLEIGEPIEAFAGGYVCDPPFFEFMRRA